MRVPSRSAAAAAATIVAAVSLVIGQDGRTYPSARTGGNYMHNYYFPPAPSSTPWAPAWSPDGKWIAVAMSGSIWKVDPASGVAHEITYDGKYHSMPDWSPDGNWIVYTADNGGSTIQLASVNVATGETRALTNDEFIYTDPVFSPDGTRVAYVSTKPNGFFNVYIRPIKNGQWAGPEIAVSQDSKYRNSRLYFGAEDLHITPAWTRDGKQLLLVSNRGVPLGSGNIWLAPAVAGGIDDGRAVVVEQTLYRARPHVSIDGKRFVYSSTRGAADQFSNLYVQPVAGGEPYKLTFFQHDAFHPRWSPDGEWIAYIDNREGLPQLALLEVYGGDNRIVRIVDRRWKRPMGMLSVRTVDDSGQATGARIHLTAADGKFYAPADAYARVSAAGDRVFHSTGEFRVELPVGKTRVTAVKGFEVWPQSADVDIVANEVTTAQIGMKRMTDMSVKGWHNGSTHVHMNYGGNLHNTLENLMMMSAAEDQDIVLEQIANKDNRILDHQFFVPGGGPHPLSRKDMLLVVGQEYRPPFWGHVFMFGMRDHLISPFTTGYEGTAIESLYPSNTDIFRKARAQGAYVGYVHAYGGERDPLDVELGGAKGGIVDAALGTTDAIEWSAAGRAGFFPLYSLWNNGIKVTAVGGEDSISNLHDEQARRLASHLCLHGRARVGHARLARWHASRTRVGHERTACRVVGKRRIARRDRDRAGGWWSCRRAGASTVDCPAAESHALLQRSIGGGHPVERRSPNRRLPQDSAGRQKRVVSRPCGRRTRGSVSTGYGLPAGIHKSHLGDRRKSAGPRPRVRRVRADSGSTDCRSSLTPGRDGARRRKRITCTDSSTRRGRCTGDWRAKPQRGQIE